MEESRKRKHDETGNGQTSSISSITNSEEEEDLLRWLLNPHSKKHLVTQLAKLACQYPSIAAEIKSNASSDPVYRKLFVHGLGWKTTSETLRAKFQVHGEIEEGAVIYNKAKKSRRFGFITYKSMESAYSALRAPSKLIDGHMAVCNLACKGLSSMSTTPNIGLRQLFVGGLSPDTSGDMLLSFFGRHGEIEEASVACDKNTNTSRCYGFVTYMTAEAAKKAIDDPQKTLGGRSLTVEFSGKRWGKVEQTQIAAEDMVEYPQTGTAYHGSHPVGYIYPTSPYGYSPTPPPLQMGMYPFYYARQ